MAASTAYPGSKYQEAMLAIGNQFDWRLGPRLTHPDDQAIGQTYLELYFQYHDARLMNPTKEQFDQLMKIPNDPAKPVWWWCDALFVAPPVWTRLYKATGDRRYLDYMDREWWITSKVLYDPQEHLFAGMVATAVLLPTYERAEQNTAAGHAFYVFNVHSGKPIEYYAGAGWSRSDIPDRAAWSRYLEHFAATMRFPLEVHWQ